MGKGKGGNGKRGGEEGEKETKEIPGRVRWAARCTQAQDVGHGHAGHFMAESKHITNNNL